MLYLYLLVKFRLFYPYFLWVSGFFRWAGVDIKSIVLSLHNETRSTAQSNPPRSPDRQLRHRSI